MRLRFRFLSALLLGLVACPVLGQDFGSCATGTAVVELTGRNVAASLYNDGWQFGREGQPGTYQVPADEGVVALRRSQLWVAGITQGAVRTAGVDILAPTFWPGPLDASTGLPLDPDDCTAFDRIWHIARADLDALNQGGTATTDIAEWPWQHGAPVTDGDGNPNNYDLTAGDRPTLEGEEMAWWVMNDAGNSNGLTLPMGLEVQVTAWTYGEAGPRGEALFLRYVLQHKGDAALADAYLGWWVDPSLGAAQDDLVGVDTSRQLAFVYNHHASDGRYGMDPPAVGYWVQAGLEATQDGRDNDGDGLVDEAAEQQGLAAFFAGSAGPPCTSPFLVDRPGCYYNRLRGRWENGGPVLRGGTGFSGATPTSYFFPDPPEEGTFWSEENADSTGQANAGGDRNWVMGLGPFDWQPGQAQTVEIGILHADGPNRLHAITVLRRVVDQLTGVSPPEPPPPVGVPVLLSPPDGATSVQNTLFVQWEPTEVVALPGKRTEVERQQRAFVPAGTVYRVEAATDASFSDPVTVVTPYNYAFLLDLAFDADYVWRVRAEQAEAVGGWSEVFAFTTGNTQPPPLGFTDFLTVANGQGALVPTVGAGASWQGFPTPNDPTEARTGMAGQWLVHTNDDGTRSSYDAFITNVTNGQPFANRLIAPFDFEIRFTEGGGLAYDPFLTGCLFEVPFELWRTGVGTPDDPSDDVRMVPYVVDADMTSLLHTDGLPAFNLVTTRSMDAAQEIWGGRFNSTDHSVDPGNDDPMTDAIYFATPIDDLPGTFGYEIWERVALQEVGLGQCDGGAFYGRNAFDNSMRRVVLVSWNGGDVCNDQQGDGMCEPTAYRQALPPTGAIFRIETTPLVEKRFEGVFSAQNLPYTVETNAIGGVLATLAFEALTITGQFEDLSSPLTSLQLCNVGHGDTCANGLSLNSLVLVDPTQRAGVISTVPITIDLAALKQGRLYLDIATADHPDGELRAFLVPRGNMPPTATAVTTPVAGSVQIFGAGRPEALQATWSPGVDPDGSRLRYRWQLATDPGFRNLLVDQYTWSETEVALPYEEVVALLAREGVFEGGSMTVYQQVITSDGSLWEAGPRSSFVLARGTDDPASVPQDFALQGNYPNPFRDVTNLVLDVPETAEVSGAIYDLLGRRVRTLPAQLAVPGANRAVRVETHGLAAGIYLYRVEVRAGSRRWADTGRMVVVQ